MDQACRYCPCCGGDDLDRVRHADPGKAVCNACGTVFVVLSVPSASLARAQRTPRGGTDSGR